MLVGLAVTLAALVIPPAAAPDEPNMVVKIDGDAVVGATLSAVVEPDDSSADFQWLRCSGKRKSECDKISGATEASYVATADDADHRLAVRARADGDAERSDLTSVVEELPSVTISGQPIVGETLRATAVPSDPTLTVSYQWLQCTAPDPLACKEIDGAIASTYQVAATDVGLLLGVRAADGTDTVYAFLTPAVQARPLVTSVTIAGQAVIGATLTAEASATGGPTPTITFQWFRCDAASQCQQIATGASYVVQPADASHTLLAIATASNAAGKDTARSAPTTAVPEPALGGVFEQPGTAPVSLASAQATLAARLRYLRPFPVVRIKGLLVDGGARVTLLRVTAPRGSRVHVRCRRPGCPMRRRTRGKGRIRALERFLPAGVRITIRVAKPGFIGKYARIVIRDGRSPARRDSCVLPGRRQASRCPAP
jgi:hypothetical protein